MAAPRSRTPSIPTPPTAIDPLTGPAVNTVIGIVDAATGGKASGGPSIFTDVADAIQAATDFLKFVGWLFHPRNILRAAEFLTGIVLIIFGFWAAMQSHGERGENFATGESALSRSGLGRVSRALAESAVTRKPTRMREAPHRTKRKAVARGRESAARGKPRKQPRKQIARK